MKRKEPGKNPRPMRCPEQNPGDPSMARADPVHADAADGPPSSSTAAVSTEHPCFKLDRWWLARVEGHDRKIAVAGVFMRNKEAVDFPAAPIAKRHEPCILETEDGTVVIISGIFDIEATLGNGFTTEACQDFSLGFPDWWEQWNVLYPEMVKSHRGSQPRSCENSDFHKESSIVFYLKAFQIGKFCDSLYRASNNKEDFSGNADAFPDSSCWPNGASRFEGYHSGDDSPTIKKSDPSNHDSNKVKNNETHLTGARILKERSHDGIHRTPSAFTVECCNDEGYVAIDDSSCMNNGQQKSHVVSLKTQDCLEKPQHAASSESVLNDNTPTSAYADMQFSKKGKQPAGTSKRRTIKKPSASNHDSNKVVNIETDDCKKTHVASLKRRGCLKKPKHAREDTPTPMKGNLSPLTYGWPKSTSMSTLESLKLKKTRSGRVVVPALDSGCQNIVYAPDGSVAAIIGLSLPAPKGMIDGSSMKDYARRKRKRTN